MPGILGFATIAMLLGLILAKKMNSLAGLVAVPVASALVGGFGLKTAGLMAHRIQLVTLVASMFIFAIPYFGVMNDAGVLDPIVDRLLSAVGSSPPRIAVGAALLALLVHLDGSGAVTFLVTVPVMLTLYRRLGIDARVLACAASMAAGVNSFPWTGPIQRAAASLKLLVAAIFNPLVLVQAVGLLFVFGCAGWLGPREARRLEPAGRGGPSDLLRRELDDAQRKLRRPARAWLNITLTLPLIAGMIEGKREPVAVFRLDSCSCVQMNYPDVRMQKERIDAHARRCAWRECCSLPAHLPGSCANPGCWLRSQSPPSRWRRTGSGLVSCGSWVFCRCP